MFYITLTHPSQFNFYFLQSVSNQKFSSVNLSSVKPHRPSQVLHYDELNVCLTHSDHTAVITHNTHTRYQRYETELK